MKLILLITALIGSSMSLPITFDNTRYGPACVGNTIVIDEFDDIYKRSDNTIIKYDYYGFYDFENNLLDSGPIIDDLRSFSNDCVERLGQFTHSDQSGKHIWNIQHHQRDHDQDNYCSGKTITIDTYGNIWDYYGNVITYDSYGNFYSNDELLNPSNIIEDLNTFASDCIQRVIDYNIQNNPTDINDGGNGGWLTNEVGPSGVQCYQDESGVECLDISKRSRVFKRQDDEPTSDYCLEEPDGTSRCVDYVE